MLSDVFGNFFSSKSAEFLHVASDSLGKRCPAFFSPVSACFARKNMCKKLSATFAFFCCYRKQKKPIKFFVKQNCRSGKFKLDMNNNGVIILSSQN